MINSEKLGKIVFLTIIAGRKQKDALLSALSGSGARLVNVRYGEGTVSASYLQSLLGLIPEENKVVINCIIANEKSDSVLEMLIEKFNFDKPNTGVAYTIPIHRVSF